MYSRIAWCGLIGAWLAAVSVAAPPAADRFAEGAVWSGKYRGAGKDDKPQDWVLTVSERKGTTVKGEIIIKGPDKSVHTIQVEGSAPTGPSGPVSLKTEKKGLGQVFLRGKLTNGVAVLVFSGTNPIGGKVAGVATLEPKN